MRYWLGFFRAFALGPAVRAVAPFGFLVLLLLSAAHAAPAPGRDEAPTAAGAAPKNILLLYSYGHGGKGIGVFDEGLLGALDAGGIGTNNLFFEYLDLERNNVDPEHRDLLREELQHRYARHRIDLIITVQQPALDFLLKEGRALAPGVPAISLQAPLPAVSEAGSRRILGLVASFDIKGTLERALELFPDTRRVVFVSGSSAADRNMALAAEKAASAWAGKLEFEYTFELSLDQMLKRVGSLPQHSIVIFTQYNRDTAGRVTVAYEVEGLIVKAANAPVFGLYDFNLRNGGVGGSVVGVKDLGERTGRAALDILHGRAPLPPTVASLDVKVIPMFDWDQIRRWGGRPDRLSVEAVFVNRSASFWESNKDYVIALAVFVLAQSLLIVALLLNRRRRALAEAELARQRDIAHRYLDIAGVMLMALDGNGRIAMINRKGAAILGRPESELIGADWFGQFVPADQRSAVREVFAQLMRGETELVERYENQVVDAAGRTMTLAWTNSLLRDATGSVTGVLSSAEDVTERNHRAAELRKAEERLALAQRASHSGVWDWNVADGTLVWTAELFDLFGLDPAACAASFETWRSVVHPDDLRQAEARIGDALRDHVPLYNEYRIVRPSGEELWIGASGDATYDSNGAPQRMVGICFDITERKRASDERRRSEARFRSYFNQPMIGIAITSPEKGWLEVNPRLCEILGYARDEITRLTWAEITHPDDIAGDVAQFERVLRGEIDGYSMDKRFTRKDGTTIHVAMSVSCVRTEDGRVDYFVALIQDITERVLLETRTRESQKMEALGTLAGGVAHDFNNALATILGNVELARQDVGAAHPALQSLEEIGKAGRRARNLVQQILAFGRRQITERKAIALCPIVQETARLLRTTLPAAVSLEAHCAQDVPDVLADATQIEQVLLNLCTNAWHALQGLERPGSIEIRLEAVERDGERFASLTVSDNGRGMDEATRGRIFEPFFTTKAMGEGTGLGLSVVHGIVKGHGASMEVRSEPGEGTRFIIHFPAAQARASAASRQNSPPAGADADAGTGLHGGGKRVLYVDDDESIVFLMKRLLERQGYRVKGFTDARAALAEVRADPGALELVVTDYNMPGISGLEVAQVLKDVRADLPVALASGYITDELRGKALAAGVRELIYKPDTAEELSRAVARLAHTVAAAPKTP